MAEVEPGHAVPAFGEHLQEEPAATSDIEDESVRLIRLEGAAYEAHVVPEHKTAIDLPQTIDSFFLGTEPVGVGIMRAQFACAWRREKAGQPALLAFDDLELPVRGVVETVRCLEQGSELRVSANGTHRQRLAGDRVAFSAGERSEFRFLRFDLHPFDQNRIAVPNGSRTAWHFCRRVLLH